ncbi:MAG: ABC transporter substrate-binding protein [Carbonactinosporaceae bacterium]
MTKQSSKTIHLAIMNAVHDLAVIVARDEGYFRDEGLDIEFVTAPGMAQVTTDSEILNRQVMFDRPLDTMYNDGGLDQYRMCEWGILKRAVEAADCGLRPRKIVALGAAMSKFAIVVAPDSEFYEPEQLKDEPIALTPFNGSNFTTLKMMEGFLSREHLKTAQVGTMRDRLEAVKRGEVPAACVMEPWISVAQKQGLRILIEAHSSRSEASSEDLDGPALAAMFRAQTRAVQKFHEDPDPYLHYLAKETGGLLEPHELQTWRLLYAPPQPYTRERFDDTYNWMVSWDMVLAGATYENAVDNRAWEA